MGDSKMRDKAMTRDDEALDQLLRRHLSGAVNPLEPSSDFAKSVMERVQQYEDIPAPIAFPWHRALPFALGVPGVVLVAIVCTAMPSLHFTRLIPTHAPSLSDLAQSRFALAIVTLLLSLLTAVICYRLAGGGRTRYGISSES